MLHGLNGLPARAVRAPDVPVPGEFGVLAKVDCRRHHRPFAKADVVLHVRPPGWICRSRTRSRNAWHVLLPCRSTGPVPCSTAVWGHPPGDQLVCGDSAKRMPNAQHFWRPAAHNKGTCTY
jgi:hypothetical protein